MPGLVVTGVTGLTVGEFYSLSRLWIFMLLLFRFRELVPNVVEAHQFHVRINCKVLTKTGFCSWSCGSKLHCMTSHLKDIHGIDGSGKGEFPKDLVFLTSTRDPLPKGVSSELILGFFIVGFF